MSESYSVERDDHIKYVAEHETAPTIPSDVRSSELYNEFQDGSEDEPLEWFEQEYQKGELRDLVTGLSERLGVELEGWRLTLSAVPTGVTEVEPKLEVTANCSYTIDIVGYDQADGSMELDVTYDQSRDQVMFEARMEGEIDFDFPDHFSREDRQLMREDIGQEVKHMGLQIHEVADEALNWD